MIISLNVKNKKHLLRGHDATELLTNQRQHQSHIRTYNYIGAQCSHEFQSVLPGLALLVHEVGGIYLGTNAFQSSKIGRLFPVSLLA